MKYYQLYEGKWRSSECETPSFSERYDLIVAGLGSAGAFCALSAAQEGLNVLGVERGSCAGGMSVQGAVNGYYNGYTGGAFEQVDADTRELLGRVYGQFTLNPEAKKIRLEQALLQAGVNIEYHAVILGVYAEEKQVCGVRLLSDGTVREVGCKFLSDSTSDGHILRMLGVKMLMGRETDGTTQPFSSVRVFRKRDGSIGRTNDDSGYINPYDDLDFSRRVIRAHAHHNELCDPEKERLLYLAPQIGVREGMRFVGEDTLTMQDIIEERRPERTLVCAYSDIDRHGVDRAFDADLYQDWYVLSNLSTVTMKIRLPMGSIVPKGWKRLVSVSRCLSLDNYASSAVRMNRDMYRMGEAAGQALALAVKGGLDSVMQVDYDALYVRLQERNCFDPRPDETKGFVDSTVQPPYAPVEWLDDEQEIRRQLATDCPGVALWSCRLKGEKIRETLYSWMQQEGEQELRLNAALALASLQDARSLPVLREIVRERKPHFFMDCRRTNQMRSVIAICYLGRFADAEMVDELIAILQPGEFDRAMYHDYLFDSYKLSTHSRLNTVYYQHVSFALASLLQIAEGHPNLREKIHTAIHEAFADGTYVQRMTIQGPDAPYGMVVRRLGSAGPTATCCRRF